MRCISPLHMLFAMAMSVIIVVLPMGHVITIIPWTIVVTIACHRESKRGRGPIACATYVFVTSFIIIAAYLAPVKTTDRMLNNPLVLPSTELTLAEMDREANFECTQWLPRNIYIVSTSENAGRRIQLRTNEVTIREFFRCHRIAIGFT